MASSHLARSLEDEQTELLLQTFTDRILLLITQVGKVGSLIQASIPPSASLLPTSDLDPILDSKHADNIVSGPEHALPSPSPSIQLTPLLGSAPTEQIQTLHSLYASQAATLVWLSVEKHGGERRPVVVGIALKKADVWDEGKERKTFLGVMEILKELLDQQESR